MDRHTPRNSWFRTTLITLSFLPLVVLIGPTLIMMQDWSQHERHAQHLAHGLTALPHPTGTASLETTWVVSDFYGQGESNCDYVVAEVRSGRVTPADTASYTEAGAQVLVPDSSGFLQLGPTLPALRFTRPTGDWYLVVISEDSLRAGWDPRCFS